jgi:hypothetical protein
MKSLRTGIALTCFVVAGCATSDESAKKPESTPQVEKPTEAPGEKAAPAKEAAAPPIQANPPEAAQPNAVAAGASTAAPAANAPPAGANLKSGREAATGDELGQACTQVCKKAAGCMPGANEAECVKTCNNVPGGSAMRPAVDKMKQCAGAADCKAFGECMGGGTPPPRK